MDVFIEALREKLSIFSHLLLTASSSIEGLVLFDSFLSFESFLHTPYLHARALVARFKNSNNEKTSFPSFEGDVLPVLNRLQFPADIADLAEWCSTQYGFENENKLPCINHALHFATQASNEAESHSSQKRITDCELTAEDESIASERFKRIKRAKNLLADRITIGSILRSGEATSERHGVFTEVVDDLIKKLEKGMQSTSEFDPEHFVKTFLSESSLLAAAASPSGEKALSVGQFRQLSVLVHRACKSMAEKYSHVQIGSIAQELIRTWLFYGVLSDVMELCEAFAHLV